MWLSPIAIHVLAPMQLPPPAGAANADLPVRTEERRIFFENAEQEAQYLSALRGDELIDGHIGTPGAADCKYYRIRFQQKENRDGLKVEACVWTAKDEKLPTQLEFFLPYDARRPTITGELPPADFKASSLLHQVLLHAAEKGVATKAKPPLPPFPPEKALSRPPSTVEAPEPRIEDPRPARSRGAENTQELAEQNEALLSSIRLSRIRNELAKFLPQVAGLDAASMPKGTLLKQLGDGRYLLKVQLSHHLRSSIAGFVIDADGAVQQVVAHDPHDPKRDFLSEGFRRIAAEELLLSLLRPASLTRDESYHPDPRFHHLPLLSRTELTILRRHRDYALIADEPALGAAIGSAAIIAQRNAHRSSVRITEDRMSDSDQRFCRVTLPGEANRVTPKDFLVSQNGIVTVRREQQTDGAGTAAYSSPWQNADRDELNELRVAIIRKELAHALFGAAEEADYRSQASQAVLGYAPWKLLKELRRVFPDRDEEIGLSIPGLSEADNPAPSITIRRLSADTAPAYILSCRKTGRSCFVSAEQFIGYSADGTLEIDQDEAAERWQRLASLGEAKKVDAPVAKRPQDIESKEHQKLHQYIGWYLRDLLPELRADAEAPYLRELHIESEKFKGSFKVLSVDSKEKGAFHSLTFAPDGQQAQRLFISPEELIYSGFSENGSREVCNAAAEKLETFERLTSARRALLVALNGVKRQDSRPALSGLLEYEAGTEIELPIGKQQSWQIEDADSKGNSARFGIDVLQLKDDGGFSITIEYNSTVDGREFTEKLQVFIDAGSIHGPVEDAAARLKSALEIMGNQPRKFKKAASQ